MLRRLLDDRYDARAAAGMSGLHVELFTGYLITDGWQGRPPGTGVHVCDERGRTLTVFPCGDKRRSLPRRIAQAERWIRMHS